MYFQIDYHSGVPVSTQIVEQVKYQVVSGTLPAGTRLPSVRTLAEQLHINPTTVARVYRTLEAEGIIYTQPGSGTFVSGRTPGLTVTEQKRRLAPALRDLVVEAGRLGVDFDKLQQWITDEINQLQKKRR